MEKANIGTIKAIKGSIVEVQFYKNLPLQHQLLTLKDNPRAQLEVYSAADDTVYCLSLNDPSLLHRGAQIINTGKTLEVPVGSSILGRIIDIFGQPQDGKGEIKIDKFLPIHQNPPPFSQLVFPKTFVETGIKAIDLFTPVKAGSKIGIFGGSGVGKTTLVTEIIYNLIVSHHGVSVFGGIGERIREGHELYNRLNEIGVLNNIVMVVGQMNENATHRFRAGAVVSTLAEYFRSEQKKDMLVFVDNVYRFVQAGNELSTLLNVIPSEDGYQPTLDTDVGLFQERLVSTSDGTITTFEAIYLPADDITDTGIQAIFPYFDSIIILSRQVGEEGRHPSIDLLSSISSLIEPSFLGEKHYRVVLEAKKLLKRYMTLFRLVSFVGEGELSPQDRVIFHRARKLLNFMTQSFFVASEQTGREGKYVPRDKTVEGVSQILGGKLDQVPDENLRYIGSLEEIRHGNKPAKTTT